MEEVLFCVSIQVSLIVNVASECGYTDYNYRQLVRIQDQFRHKGFTVLAFPCNQFGQQEPGDNQEILSFVKDRFNINFPIFSKIEVMGKSTADIYRYLIENTGSVPSWNFCKYLVNQSGEVVQFFSEKADFSDITDSVEYLLARKRLQEEL